jgi:Phosphotransferase enzyme family
MHESRSPTLPPGLERALGERGARVARQWVGGQRTYLIAQGPSGDLFGRFSTDPNDRAVMAHEASVRAVLAGERGPLRVPAVLARGDAWMLEEAVRSDANPADAARAAVGASARLAELTLPEPPSTSTQRRARLGYRLRLLRRPSLLRELTRARKLVAASELPLVASHGDYYPGNVLAAGGSAWVIDWELCGRLPLGYDLLHYWTDAEDDEARTIALEGALELVGHERRAELMRLRYAVAVRATASKLAAAAAVDRDPAGAKRLLSLLPQLLEGLG